MTNPSKGNMPTNNNSGNNQSKPNNPNKMHYKVLLDVDLVPYEKEDQLTLLVELTAPSSPKQASRPGQAVQCVIDRSGSMSGERLEAAKGSILRLVDRLAPQDSFGVVAFDDTALVIAPMRPMADHHIPSLKRAIASMDTGGSTDISAGFLLGLREVARPQAPGGSTLLLVSDGQANSGERDPEFFRDVASKSATERIQSSSIGVGNGYDETILEAIAQGGGGAHRFANTVDEAIGAIAAEVDDLLEKTVVNAVLRISPTPMMQGAPSIEMLQRLPHWKEKEDYVIQLGDFHAGEERRFLIVLNVPQMQSLGLAQIATITIEYLDLNARSEVSISMPVNVNVVPDDVAKGRIQDPIVKAERLILEAQSEKERAADEMRQGEGKKASMRLKKTAERLRRQAAEIPANDERSAESLRIIRSEADEMQALAESAENDDALYSSKRMRESFSQNSRSRKPRNKPDSTSN